MHLGLNFERALTYALHVHGGHVRKGTKIPYFSHLMAVSATVIENGGSEDEAIAALLHDAVEDQGGRPRLQDITDRFGSNVARIVAACSDSLDAAAGQEKEAWLPRKRRYIAHLKKCDPSILLVSAADKLHNARAISRDAAHGGRKFWNRFGKSPEQTIAYYSALHATLAALYPSPVTSELGQAVEVLESFVKNQPEHARWVALLKGSRVLKLKRKTAAARKTTMTTR